MRQGNDLKVVTAPNDAVDDEDAQNGKEKKVVTAPSEDSRRRNRPKWQRKIENRETLHRLRDLLCFSIVFPLIIPSHVLKHQ
ncbi:MAG: hypothetical protein WC966_06160 [Bradymonadales bacterium]|jgi:hypothetical protein